VEPAIFGTLLERALDPTERHALGAHYTPRAYVERLVLPTVVEPLRADWANAQAAAIVLAREAEELDGKKREAKLEEARAEIRRFHHQLCTTRVLDPACGSGNFLYVTLEHLKRLEGEVMNQLEALGQTQEPPGPGGRDGDAAAVAGIELNERAAALAELVLWIGWLQWHDPHASAWPERGRAGGARLPQHRLPRCGAGLGPCQEPAYGADGPAVMTRWDGVTFKPHPVTGEGRARRGRAGAAVALRQPAPRRVAAGGLHRGESAVHRLQANARSAGRWLCRCSDAGLAQRARYG
jgi:hypothetical protein